MDKLDKLIAAYCDGYISDEDSKELEKILADSPEARRKLIEYTNIDAGLKEITEAENDIFCFPQDKTKRESRIWLYAAAALFIINLILVFRPSTEVKISEIKVPAVVPQEIQSNYEHKAVAKITRAVKTQIKNNAALNPGRVKLESGLIQIEFFSGATMVLEGPAEIDLISSMKVAAISGKMHVKVPETAQGFVVDTGEMQVHDLGTEFAIDMNSKSPEVHVLDGEVEILHKNQKLKTLFKSGSIAWDKKSAEISNIEPRKDFISYREINKLNEIDHQARQQEWLNFLDSLKTRDDLILLYDFQQEHEWQRTLKNKAKIEKMEGAIIGAQWCEGRWKEKSALDFKSIDDRIRLNIPGEFTSMTFACWVKIDSFDRWLSSLLLTDGFKKGEPSLAT